MHVDKYIDTAYDTVKYVADNLDELRALVDLATGASSEAITAANAINEKYLGVQSSEPSTDLNGDPVTAGAIFYDSTAAQLKIYDGSVWQAPTLASNDALTSANNAATSATNAATSESNALGYSTTAATEASDAASSAALALSYANAAQTAQTGSEAALEALNETYLGSYTSNPTVDNNGNALAAGALYYNTLLGRMQLYNGASWVELTDPTNWGYGTLALQDADNISITDGEIEATYYDTHIELSGTTATIDCSAGNAFSITLSGNTILNITNKPFAGQAYGFLLKIKQDAGNSGYVINWFDQITWVHNSTPTLTSSANAEDIFVFYTVDASVTWYGFSKIII